jgi:hypothetical protein
MKALARKKRYGAFITTFIFMVVASAMAQAKTVHIQVNGDGDSWSTQAAMEAAQASFTKAGYQVMEGSGADVEADITVEKAYSHHSVSPTIIIGGLLDLWNNDNAHATVSSVISEGGKEVSRETAHSTKHDIPLFTWATKAASFRKKALKSAVQSSLKPFLSAKA